MTPAASYLTHWYYHLPDLVIAVLIYLLIARLALAFARRTDPGTRIERILRRITDPVLKSVAAITPRAVPPALVIVFAVMWLVVARLALFIAVTARGVRLASG